MSGKAVNIPATLGNVPQPQPGDEPTEQVFLSAEEIVNLDLAREETFWNPVLRTHMRIRALTYGQVAQAQAAGNIKTEKALKGKTVLVDARDERLTIRDTLFYGLVQPKFTRDQLWNLIQRFPSDALDPIAEKILALSGAAKTEAEVDEQKAAFPDEPEPTE